MPFIGGKTHRRAFIGRSRLKCFRDLLCDRRQIDILEVGRPSPGFDLSDPQQRAKSFKDSVDVARCGVDRFLIFGQVGGSAPHRLQTPQHARQWLPQV